jgi:hypothetical protein
MISKRWKRAVIYPLTLWIVFLILAFLLGFTSWPNITQMSLLGDAFPSIIGIAFGLWIGAESKNEFSFAGALQNAFIVSFLVGMIELLLTIVLINNSPLFVTYSTAVYHNRETVPMPLIDLVVSTWIGIIFVCLTASAASYSFLSRSHREHRRLARAQDKGKQPNS